MAKKDLFFNLLKGAWEIDHDRSSDIIYENDWDIVKVHRFGWESRSGAHALETNIPPFFESHSYSYYIVKPVFALRERDLIINEGEIIYDVCEYPIPRCLVLGLAKALDLGYFIWHVTRGINTVLFCKYISTWDEEIVNKIVLKLIVNSLTK